MRQVERVSATRLWELFASRLALLGDVALRADTIPEAIDTLGKQVDALRLKHGIADEEVFHWLGKKELKSLPLSKASVEPAGRREQAFTADFGITLCDAAVAESGTLVLASQSGRSRLTSLAPPVHFCLLPFSRLVPDLDDVTRGFHKLKNDNEVWITGSSRTADIEGILIRGVHGPGSLIAIGVASE